MVILWTSWVYFWIHNLNEKKNNHLIKRLFKNSTGNWHIGDRDRFCLFTGFDIGTDGLSSSDWHSSSVVDANRFRPFFCVFSDFSRRCKSFPVLTLISSIVYFQWWSSFCNLCLSYTTHHPVLPSTDKQCDMISNHNLLWIV